MLLYGNSLNFLMISSYTWSKPFYTLVVLKINLIKILTQSLHLQKRDQFFLKYTSYPIFATPFCNDAMCPVFGYFQANQLFGLISLLQNTAAGDLPCRQASIWFWYSGSWFWFGSVKKFGNGEMNIWFYINIFDNWFYHGWGGHTGVIIISVHLCFIALANIIPIRAKGGKAYPFRCVHFVWNGSTIHTCRSGCQLMYFGI